MNFFRRAYRSIRAIAGSNSPSNVALGQLTASGLALISAPIVARAIGPEGRGETAAALAAFYIWPIIASLGMHAEIRRATASGEGGAALRRARDIMLVLLLPSVGVGWLLDISIFASLDASARVCAFVGIVAGPLMVSWMCDQSLLIGRRKYQQVAVIQVAQPVTYLIFVLSGWLSGAISVAFVLTASIAGTLLTAVVAASMARVSLRGNRAATKAFLKRSSRYAGSSMAEAATNRLDQVIALPLLGAAQAGLYAVAATIGGLALPLGHALAADSFNEVARSRQGDERDRLRRAHLRSAIAAGLMSGAALGALTPLVIPLLFGSEFGDAVIPALVLCLGGAVAVPSFVAFQMLAAEGRGVEMTVAQVARLLLATGLLVILGPSLGAVGAALAAALGIALLFAILVARTVGDARVLLVRPTDFKVALSRFFRGSGE